jgi:hypothetical protein
MQLYLKCVADIYGFFLLRGMEYGVLQVYGFFNQNACKPSWDPKKVMGYMGLWVA